MPQTFDLSGSWVLDESRSDPSPDISAIWNSEKQAILAGRKKDPVDSASFIFQDFPVVRAESVEIEQDDSSMGVHYERAPYRDYKLGTQERDGWKIFVRWDGESLVVRKSRDSLKGVERYTLQDDGQVLHISIVVNAANNKVNLTRLFMKQS